MPPTDWRPYRGVGRFGTEFRYVPHLECGRPGEYLTDRLTQEALCVIDHAGERPFFLQLAHHAPHTPLEAKPDHVAYVERRHQPADQHQDATYAAMVRSLDESAGRVLSHLEARGLTTNTMAVLASDNGGLIGIDRKSGHTTPTTSNAPLRSGKGSCSEGGLRVPLIVRWPGTTPPGTVCHQPVILTDRCPTLLAAAAAVPNAAQAPDGLDLTPLLRDPTVPLARRAPYFHYPHY